MTLYSNSISVDSFGFSVCSIKVAANNSFISSTPILIPYGYFSYFIDWLGTAWFKTANRVVDNVEYRGNREHLCPLIGLSSIVLRSYLKPSLLSLNPQQQHKQSSARNSKPATPSHLKTHWYLYPLLLPFQLS